MPQDGETNAQNEYANTVIQLAGEDTRQVYLRVTGVLGLAALFLTQLPFDDLKELPLWTRWVFVGGLLSAVGSAALYFHYLSKVHLGRLKMASCIRDGRAAEVDDIWAGTGSVWTEYGWAFNYGGRLMVLSVILMGTTLCALLDLI